MEKNYICSFNGEKCDGCGDRKNNWHTCQWGSVYWWEYNDMECEGIEIPVWPKI